MTTPPPEEQEHLPVLGVDDGWGVTSSADPFIQSYYTIPLPEERCPAWCMTGNGPFQCIRKRHEEGDGNHVIWA